MFSRTTEPVAICESCNQDFSEKLANSTHRFWAKRSASWTSPPVIDENGIGIVAVNEELVSESSWFGISYPMLASTIQQLDDNEDVRGIVLDINSPGGEVSGLIECATMISNCKKPKMAFVSGLCCSAAYLLATATGRIVASETSEIGSVGIIASYVNRKKYNEKVGIEEIIFRSKNASKKNLDPSTEEGEKAVNKSINKAEEMFISAIANYRGVATDDIVSNFGQGEIFYAQEALERGMIDALCETYNDAISQFCSQLEGSEEGNMDLSKATNDELTAAVQARPDLLAALSTGAKSDAVAMERKRITDLMALSAFGAYAQPIVSQAVTSGETVEDVMPKLTQAAAQWNQDLAKTTPLEQAANSAQTVNTGTGLSELEALNAQIKAAASKINQEGKK